MARTVEDLLREDLGNMHLQLIRQTAEVEKLQEEIARLQKPELPKEGK